MQRLEGVAGLEVCGNGGARRLAAVWTLAFLGFLFPSASPLLAQKLYSVDRDSDRLREINPLTAQTVASRPITLSGKTVTGGLGLATDPVSGKLFALLRLGQPKIKGEPTGRELVTIDPVTGVATDIGLVDGGGLFFSDLAFIADGTLFGITGDGSTVSPSTLFTINKSTGAPTFFRALGNGDDGETIAFNPTDGLMYHSSGTNDFETNPPPPTLVFEKFDPASPSSPITLISPFFNTDLDEATAITYYSGNDFLWADLQSGGSTVREGRLLRVSTTGTVRFVGVLDHVAPGLAFVAATGPGTLSVSPPHLEFFGVAGGGAQTMSVGFSGVSGSTFTATATISDEQRGLFGNWLSVSPASGITTPTGLTALNVTVNFELLRLGIVVGDIAVTAGAVVEGDIVVTAGTTTARVHVKAAARSALAELGVSPQAVVFATVENGVAPHSRDVRIFNHGEAGLQWSIALSDPAPWLTVTQMSGSTDPLGANVVTLSVNLAGRAPGVYQTRLTVTATGAANSPRDIAVTLHVVSASAAPRAELSPTGMVFVGQPGSSALPPQTLTVSNVGGSSFTFTTSLSGAPWASLSQTPTNPGAPVTIQVSANATGLAAGTYRGKIIVTPSSGAVQEVELLLVVAPTSSPVLQRQLPSAGACAPQTMDMAATTIGNGVSLPVSFPRTLLALVVDNCGASVSNATVVASVEGLAITLQPVGSGLYSGTWTPVKESASVALSIAATHPTLGTVSRNYSVATSAAGGVSLPVVSADGVLEAAALTPLRPLAPGSIVSVFGSQFATGNNVATTVPLPQTLGGVSVRMGEENAPLYYVGPGQINAQVPFTAKVGESMSVIVNANGKLTAPQNYLIAAAEPGVFQAGGVAAVLDSQGRGITAANPARLGDTIQIFTNGLGQVDQAVVAGAASPQANALFPVTATVGGAQVPVSYAGLAPGYVGLYRVDVQLTGAVPTGDAVPVVIRQNGIASNPNLPVSIPIR